MLLCMMILLVLVLCKSLIFGQTHVFSSDRTVFWAKQQNLPILWYDLPKMEPESEASLLSYLLNPPKLDYRTSYYTHPEISNKTKTSRSFNESIAHQPHSENKIYLGSHIQAQAYHRLPWYRPALLTVGCILIGCIIVIIIQMVYFLLIHRRLFSNTLRNPPSSEERWNLLLVKLDKICDEVDKKDKEESEQKEAALTIHSVQLIEIAKCKKTD